MTADRPALRIVQGSAPDIAAFACLLVEDIGLSAADASWLFPGADPETRAAVAAEMAAEEAAADAGAPPGWRPGRSAPASRHLRVVR